MKNLDELYLEGREFHKGKWIFAGQEGQNEQKQESIKTWHV